MSELNLISPDLRAKRKKAKNILSYASIGLVILIVFGAFVLVPKLYLIKLQSDEKAISKKITASADIVKKNKELLTQANAYKVYKEKIDSIISKKTDVSEKIRGIEKNIPSDITLSDIKFVNGVVNLKGSTANYTSIGSFVANLQISEDYKISRILKVKSLEDSKDPTKSTGFEFEIVIELQK